MTKREGSFEFFDIIKSITFEKNEDMVDDPFFEKMYSPKFVNSYISSFADGIFHANEMNKFNGLSKKQQYTYYLQSLRKAKKFKKNETIDTEQNEFIDNISNYYNCSNEVAKNYAKLLTDEDKIIINNFCANKNN